MKEIAFQAGLSLATVDRVLHDRPGVRAMTRARVRAAIDELQRQYGASARAGRRISLDVVIEAPDRFSTAVRAAFEAEVPALRPANVSVRFHIGERLAERDMLDVLRAIRRRGSDGVVLKARASAAIIAAAEGLMAAGIPVVTLVTDLPEGARLAYVGIDNRAAGQAAAWLMGQMLGERRCGVLTTLSSAMFSGEDDRVAGFRAEMDARFPNVRVERVSEGLGLARDTETQVSAALAAHPDIEAVYSVGGGNRAILKAFETAGRACRVFAGHDLDRTNRALLIQGRLSFVIDHDLGRDTRTVCQQFLRHHRMLPDRIALAPSRFEIVTPYGL